jgi:hypothetical protein
MIAILEELPLSLKGLIAKQAYFVLIKNIKILEKKPDNFYWHFLPKLK